MTTSAPSRRKLREAIVALWLERQLSKDEILTRYLNSVYLGGGAVGMPTAARMLFGKKVADLSLPEAAMLAGLIKAPSQLSPLKNPDGAQARAAVVLDAMVDAGAIDKAAAENAKLHPAALKLDDGAVGDRIMVRRLGLPAGDRDHRLLHRARCASAPPSIHGCRRLPKPPSGTGSPGRARRAGASQAALVAMRPDGAVVAMVGGADYGQSVFNRAFQARRQPGSAFKLFVYLAALRHGFTPNDVIDDTPLDVNGWQPQNFDGRFHGRVTLADAFAHSLNVASARLAMTVGIDQVIAAAHDLGIATPLGNNPSIALGTSEVTLLDLTAAYAAVSAGTMPVRPWGITGFGAEEQAQLFPAGAPAQPKRSLAPYRQPLIEPPAASRQPRHRPGGAARRLRRRQDRHQPEPPRRLVHRLQRSARRRRLGRQRRRHADGRGHRRLAAGADLEGFSHQGRQRRRGGCRARRGAARRRPSIRRKPARSASDAPGEFSPAPPGVAAGRCDPFACAQKYRSFRLSDCTYQPYDGGPRRVCEQVASHGRRFLVERRKGVRRRADSIGSPCGHRRTDAYATIDRENTFVHVI